MSNSFELEGMVTNVEQKTTSKGKNYLYLEIDIGTDKYPSIVRVNVFNEVKPVKLGEHITATGFISAYQYGGFWKMSLVAETIELLGTPSPPTKDTGDDDIPF